MTVTRQYFELQGELLDMAISWKRDVSDPHAKRINEVLQKEFGTSRAMVSGGIGVRQILHVGDDAAPIEGMVKSKKYATYLTPSRTKEGKAKAAILKSLDYPIAGEPVLEKLGVLKSSWIIGSYMVAPQFFQIGDRWFVSVPAEKVPTDWLTNPDLKPMLPYEMQQLEAAQKESAAA